MAKIIRLCGAILMVVSLCLPFSQCSNISVPVNQHLTTHSTTIEYLLPPNFADLRSPGFYPVILAFIYPLGLMLLRQTAKIVRILFWLEILPLGFAAYLTYILGTGFYRPLSGAYLAMLGIALSASAWLAEIYNTIRPGGTPLYSEPRIQRRES